MTKEDLFSDKFEDLLNSLTLKELINLERQVNTIYEKELYKKQSELKPADEDEYIIPYKIWKDDYQFYSDGTNYWATKDKVSDLCAESNDRPDWATHVVHYGK